ncbi:MAG TPA: glycosyltransferase family 2 protein [Clostridiales bacterium]|nr:glycosyltransferase family 2 protein [Clostridiales bacterium]
MTMHEWLYKQYNGFVEIRNFMLGLFVRKPKSKEIPIIINNRNRYTFLKEQIEWFQARGYTNIIVLDNASTYPPLLEYYESLDCEIVYLGKNLGYKALEQTDLYKKIRKSYFVYTDPDVVPADECPANFMETFLLLLHRYPLVQKVGFSLKIDDLPDEYEKKDEVIAWEQKHWERKLDDISYQASIDTTFALHRPYARISKPACFKMIRTAPPFTAHHLPWYFSTDNPSEEEQYYKDHATIGGHWTNGRPDYVAEEQ